MSGGCWSSVDDLTEVIAKSVPEFADVNAGALAAATDGVLIAAPGDRTDLPAAESTPDQRVSYDYRLVVGRRLYDRGVTASTSESLAALAPGSAARVNPLDLEQLGVAAGTEIRVIAPKKTVALPVAADPAVARGAVFVPFNQAGTNIADVIDASAGVTDVRLERL
jgi:NADH-quinone oxidoreductase subunit G